MININSYDMMIEKYRRELMNASKRSVFPAQSTQERESSVPTVAEAQPQNAPQTPSTVAEPQIPPVSAEPPDMTDYGSLRIEVYAADRAYAVPSATVTVTKTGDPDTIIFNGLTNTSGMIDALSLPAPSPLISAQPSAVDGYASYDILVTHPRYRTQRFIGVPVFAGVESVQPVRMQPLGEDNTEIIVYEREPSDLTQNAQMEE